MKILITGAAGFIGSGMVSYINSNYPDYEVVAVDDFSKKEKKANIANKNIALFVNRDEVFDNSVFSFSDIDFIIHLGARTDTTEMNMSVFDKLNIGFTKSIWDKACEYNIPVIYASSAATYGDGELGYVDDETIISSLKPLNPYGVSKNEIDKWILANDKKPDFWIGLKFFNVFGPNEYHKGRMASVVFHAFNQIRKTDKMKLFRSHNKNYKHGEQIRDFIYVKDVLKVIDWLHLNKNTVKSGIYNLGTGKARTFNDLAMSVFYALKKTPKIEYIDTPEDIRDKYQYFTEANMDKLHSQGYNKPFYSLEKGVIDYVENYLLKGEYY